MEVEEVLGMLLLRLHQRRLRVEERNERGPTIPPPPNLLLLLLLQLRLTKLASLKFLLKIQVLLQSFFTLEILINLPSLIHFLLTWFRQTHLKAFHLKAFYLKAFHLKAFHLRAFHLKAFHLETFLHFMIKQTCKRGRDVGGRKSRFVDLNYH